MARDDKARLYGVIMRIREVVSDGKVAQLTIRLRVARHPQATPRGELRTDDVTVVLRDEGMIRYFKEQKATTGDMMETFGVLCTIRAKKIFTCKECHTRNSYEGTMDYIHPLFIRTDTIRPKRTEVIIMTDDERDGKEGDVFKILKEKKHFPGDIIESKDLGRTGDDQNSILITVREKVTDKDVEDELGRLRYVSNLFHAVGNLCRDPEYAVTPTGGRVCTYQLGISRKLYIKEDDPENRADYPWVKSLGEQAEKDRDSLMKGSLVLITGSIQARDFIVGKECSVCHAMNKVKDSTMEIVPRSVEYLRNCNLSGDDEDEGEPEGVDFDETDGTGEIPSIHGAGG